MTRRRAADAHRALFFAIGAVCTALLLLVVANLAPQRKTGIDEAPPLPALATLLPPGADAESARTLELIDSADPAFAVAFRRSAWELLLVSWDRRAGSWRTSAPMPLSGDGFAYESVTDLRAASVGGSGPLISVRGNAGGAYADAVSLFSRGTDRLAPVAVTAQNGAMTAARFPVGASVLHSESFEVEDIDGDGVTEAIAESIDRSATPLLADVRVYAWRDGGLVYDRSLSEIMTLSRRTFPEPEDGLAPTSPPEARE